MMKRILFLMLVGIGLGACADGLNSDLTIDDVKHLQTTEAYTVKARSGYVAIVTVGQDTIAKAYSDFPIMAPKGVEKRVTYAPLAEPKGRAYDDDFENEIGVNNSKLFQVICFEDSRVGDYDYNDLVIHVKYQQQGNVFGFGVQPVALGSTKDIKLGCDVYKGDNLVYSGLLFDKTCREQMFNDGKNPLTGFLNVYFDDVNFKGNPIGGGEPRRAYLGSTIKHWDISKLEGNGAMRVEWFIEVDGNTRLYALSLKHLKSSLDAEKLPYGLVITSTGTHYTDKNGSVCGLDWFNYPQEGRHMQSVYPEIWKWMTGEKDYDSGLIYREGQNICPEGAFNANDLGVYVIDDDASVLTNGTAMN